MKSSGFNTLTFQIITDLYYMFKLSLLHLLRYFLYTLLNESSLRSEAKAKCENFLTLEINHSFKFKIMKKK